MAAMHKQSGTMFPPPHGGNGTGVPSPYFSGGSASEPSETVKSLLQLEI